MGHGEQDGRPSKRSAGNVARDSRPLIVRHATPRDRGQVVAFYEDNSHSYNHPRTRDVFYGAISGDRKLLLVEHEGPPARMVAAAAVFGHLGGSFRELGATRVVDNGLGLQRLLTSARIVQELIMGPESDMQFFCTVIPENPASIHNIRSSLFVPWDNPDSELLHEKAKIAKRVGRSADVLYFRLPPEAFSSHAQKLLDYASTACLRRKSTETSCDAGAATRPEEVKLLLKLETLMYFRPAVVELAQSRSMDKHANV